VRNSATLGSSSLPVTGLCPKLRNTALSPLAHTLAREPLAVRRRTTGRPVALVVCRGWRGPVNANRVASATPRTEIQSTGNRRAAGVHGHARTGSGMQGA
jgi:hypothetical protein